MIIIVKNKHTLLCDDFKFTCSVGKRGFSNSKKEGDKKTPRGSYKIGNLYYRSDRVKKPITSIKCIKIKKDMGWCNDINNKLKYNKRIKIDKSIKFEKLYRRDYKYNYFIPIKYNWHHPKIPKGSAIFIHLTKNYKPTAGCIALAEKDFLILLKLVKKNTKIQIN
tara:strand:+ start:504 stop:998 length:495 start_codon:yes stop_codon:yes gene_type:complete